VDQSRPAFDRESASGSLSVTLGGGPPQTDAALLAVRFARTPAAQRLLARVEAGGVLSAPNVAQPGHALLTAALHTALPGRPLVLVVDGLKAQECMLQDLQTWLGAGSGDRAPLFYPDWEILPHEAKLPHVDVISDRLATLSRLAAGNWRGSAPVIVASVTAMLQRTFAPDELRGRLRTVRRGDTWDPLDLVEWLEDQGFEPEAQVAQKGTHSLRGGIVDVWPPAAPWPVRLEFFGNELESLREFDPLTQLSRGIVNETTLGPAGELGILKRLVQGGSTHGLGTLLDHLPPGTVLLLSEPSGLSERAQAYAKQVPAGDPFYIPWAEFQGTALARGDRIVELGDAHKLIASTSDPEEELSLQSLEFFRPLGTRLPELAVAESQRREFFEQMHRWLRSGISIHVFCNNEGERQRFGEIWDECGLGEGQRRQTGTERGPDDEARAPALPAAEAITTDPRGASGESRLHLHIGALGRGFLFEAGRMVVVTDAEVFGRYKILRPRRLRSAHAQTARSLLDIDFTEFEEGDYVVHVEHGIGRFLGLQTAPSTPGYRGAPGGPGHECLVIEYAPSRPEDQPPKLYVPVSEAHLVSKYVGAGKARPPLNTMGGVRWAKAKMEAQRAVADLAAELLEIQAARESDPGHAFPPDAAWQREFEAAFVFEETPDQLQAIEATKEDMERARPMDRLICGDVGFGKTEVAIRAAFKAVMGGRQVAVLVPTTVLAQQHFNTFRERMSDYPIRVELLSRFRTRREQHQVIESVAAGAVDIVIGTHRLVQKDVRYKDLGLVIIDEEQRFGVRHKERFKQLRRTVDVLTLSATPIPRTLYLALSGARDMSTIETPPQDRLPIETVVSAYDERLIRDAIQRELNRQGQVFFLHNRVSTIDSVAMKLRALIPHARIAVGHGQMDADELEEVMTRFVAGEADVLLSTTIIESGLDIPNANTIIIDRADRFGLSELYQLRGRVGRYKHQAYAYLLIPRHAQLLTEARKRISAIRQYSSLGSGFKIAMRDLEIRGAGNLLGPQQSGHITAVGFDLYCQLLKQSISAHKGEIVKPRLEVQIRLDFLALNPAEEGARPAKARPVPSPRSQRNAGLTAPPLEEGKVPGNLRVPAVAALPSGYLPDPKQRLEIHRRLAQVAVPADLRDLRRDLRDRFGPPPLPVELLLQVAELRLFAAALDITSIETREDRLMLMRNGDFIQVGGRFPRLTRRDPRARLQEIRRFLGSLSPNTSPPSAPSPRHDSTAREIVA
jgi:transcription-repair coupling factor (superfamily II helicase)